MSDYAYTLGLRAFLPLADLELNALALVKRLEAVALDLGVVDENIRTAVVLLNEAKALLSAEPLHTAQGHVDISHAPPAESSP